MRFRSLVELASNDSGIIECINAGRNASQRLSDMGLVKGTRIKILRKAPFEGPIELEVKGTKLVIGRSLANKVFVNVVKEK